MVILFTFSNLILFIMLKLTLFLKCIYVIHAIWPVAYNVNLSQSETFVISEVFSSDDESDVYDDEMIKEDELEPFDLPEDNVKHYRLHQTALRRNKKSDVDNFAGDELKFKLNETNMYEDLEAEPWESGFVNNNGSFIEIEDVNIKEDKQASEKFGKEKRQQSISKNEDYVNYDYAGLKADYETEIVKAELAKNTLNYTDVKEEETMQDAIKTALKFGTAKNCTQEEMKGIGIKAAKCFISDLNKKKTPKQRAGLFRRIIKYILIWFSIYVLIAVPCWCQNGLCCCCFTCKFCYPKKNIDEVKKFFVDNPPGVYHVDGKKLKFTATHYEKYAQKQLEKVLMKL